MSEGSSSAPARQFSRRGWGPIIAVALGFAAYKIPEYIISAIAPSLLPLLPKSDNVRSFILYGLFEAMTIGAIVLIVKLFKTDVKAIGLGKFKPAYISRALLGYCAYFVLTILVSYVTSQIIHVGDEPQSVGFSAPNGLELALAFAALVMVVPVAEELLFRGFIFKGVREGFSFTATALVVSVLFAAAHGQLNVGLDVFALSLVLCYLREKTGSIWPGILLHGLKNAVAFFMLFIYNVH